MNHCEYKNHMLNRHSKKTSFVCEECGEGFKIKNELNKHFQIHDKGKIFSCSLCPKTYTKRSSYEVHLRRHEIIKNRTCEECGEVCRDMKKIAWHMRKVHGQTGETYICDSCGLNFVNKSSLLDHMNEHFDLLSSKIKLENNLKQEFNLRECHIKLERIDASEKYDLRNEWEEFIETTLDVPHFEQLIISTIKEEQGVVFKEEPEDYFLDDDTGFEAIHGFDDSDNDTNFPGDMEIVKLELKTEESDEEENEPLIKLLKGKKSIKKVAKKTKRQPKKASAERPNLFEKDFENKIIECEICDKVFTNVPSLRTHIYRLHNKNPDQKVKKQEKNYVCPVCQHRHYSKQSLDEHYRAVHDKAKDFVCEVCNLDFAWKNGLNRHKCAGYKVQERKPYKPGKLDITCRENKEMFEEKIEVKTESEAESETNDEYLDDDESGSADEKQKEKARCDLCDVAFDNKRLLQKHNYRNHNLNTKMIKIEKVSCFYCCLEFNSKASLRQHRHRKHNKNPASTKKVQEKASCEICSLEFNSKDSLRQHKTRKHSAKNSKGMVKSQCSICELWFNSKEALGMHKYRKHNAQPPVIC